MINISRFIEDERKYYNGESNNLFSLTIGAIQSNYEKALMLREWSIPLIEEYGKLFADPHKAGPEEIDRSIDLGLTKKIEILFESFFIFSSILCDDIAQIFTNLFGSARDVKLGTHRKLSENFVAYASALSLGYDPSFIDLAKYLESELCDYRDKQLVHDINYRKVWTVSYSNITKDVTLMYGMLYPKTTDKYVSSKGWGELLDALEKYVAMTLEIIRNNRNKVCAYKK